MITHRKLISVAAAALAAAALAACRAEEQGRPLSFDKGNYQGPADTSLNEAKLKELNDRLSLQGSTSVGAAGVPVIERPTEEKPAPTSKELNERLRIQAGPPDVPRKSEGQSQISTPPAAAAPTAAPAGASAPAATPQSPAPSTQPPANPANN